MATGLTWLGVVLAIVLSFWAIARENDRKRHRSVEQWERENAAGLGKTTQYLRAGALGLESILVDQKREAIQYQKDEEQGMTKTGSKGDDADRTSMNE